MKGRVGKRKIEEEMRKEQWRGSYKGGEERRGKEVKMMSRRYEKEDMRANKMREKKEKMRQ